MEDQKKVTNADEDATHGWGKIFFTSGIVAITSLFVALYVDAIIGGVIFQVGLIVLFIWGITQKIK